MVLTKDKALELLKALNKYCKKHKIAMSRNKSIRYIELAKIVMERYSYVILMHKGTKFICNSPKFLKKWALHESLRNITPLFYNIGYMAFLK